MQAISESMKKRNGSSSSTSSSSRPCIEDDDDDTMAISSDQRRQPKKENKKNPPRSSLSTRLFFPSFLSATIAVAAVVVVLLASSASAAAASSSPPLSQVASSFMGGHAAAAAAAPLNRNDGHDDGDAAVAFYSFLLGHDQNRFKFPAGPSMDELLLGDDEGGRRYQITSGDVDDDDNDDDYDNDDDKPADWATMTMKSDDQDDVVVGQQQQAKNSKRSGALNKNFIRFGRAGAGASSRSSVIGSPINRLLTENGGDNDLSHYINQEQVMEKAAAEEADDLNKRQSRRHPKTGGLGSNFIRFGRSFYPTGRSSFGGRSQLARVVDAAASAAADSFGRGSRAFSGGGHPSSSQQSSMRRKLMSNFIRFGRRAPDYNNNKTSPSVAPVA